MDALLQQIEEVVGPHRVEVRVGLIQKLERLVVLGEKKETENSQELLFTLAHSLKTRPFSSGWGSGAGGGCSKMPSLSALRDYVSTKSQYSLHCHPEVILSQSQPKKRALAIDKRYLAPTWGDL